jgi:prevent-host-death family protein
MERRRNLGIEEIGHRELRESLAPLLRRMAETGRPAAVTNRNRLEAVLVPAPTFQELQQAQMDLAELRDVLPLLLAAAAAGASIPSTTLERLGVAPDFDWRRLNAFQAAFPIRLSQTEDGHELVRSRGASILAAEETTDELELLRDDE